MTDPAEFSFLLTHPNQLDWQEGVLPDPKDHRGGSAVLAFLALAYPEDPDDHEYIKDRPTEDVRILWLSSTQGAWVIFREHKTLTELKLGVKQWAWLRH